MLSGSCSIVAVACFTGYLLVSPALLTAQSETGKESGCRWIIHEPTVSICIKLPNPRPGETEEHQREVMYDLLRRIDELKKLAAISADLKVLTAEAHQSHSIAEQQERIRIIGKTSWSLCRDRNRPSACRASFHAGTATGAGELETELVLRTMLADVSFCIGSVKDAGTADVHYPERLQNIAAGAARLSVLAQGEMVAGGPR